MGHIGNEVVKTYTINGKKYDIIGCWDSDTPENSYDFYDVYDEKGNCMNEGDPFYKLPNRKQIKCLADWWERQ